MKHMKTIGTALAVAALSAGVSCFCYKQFGPQETIIVEKTRKQAAHVVKPYM